MIHDASYWRGRFVQAMDAFSELKTLTKNIPAATWTPEYRMLAERIHTLGRDVFYVEVTKVTSVPDATGFSIFDPLDEGVKDQGL